MSNKNLSYAEAFTELEAILTQMEKGEPDVDRLTIQVRRASELIKYCRRKLRDTETEIERVIDEMEEKEE